MTTDVSFSPKEPVVTVGTNQGFFIWSLNPVILIHSSTEYPSPISVTACASVPSKSLIIFASPNGSSDSITGFDYSKKSRLFEIMCPSPVSNLIAFPTFFVVSYQNLIVLYDLEKVQEKIKFKCEPVFDVNYTHIAYSNQCELVIMNLETEQKCSLTAHNHPISQIKFSSSGDRIASASIQGTLVRVFSLTGEMLQEFRRGSFQSTIFSLAFMNESIVLTSSQTLHLFTIGKKNSIKYDVGMKSVVGFLNENTLALVKSDGTLEIISIKREKNSFEQTSSRRLVVSNK